MWTDDPIADFNRHDREQEAQLRKRPCCSWCGEHITDDYALYFDGQYVCEECIKENLKEVEEE